MDSLRLTLLCLVDQHSELDALLLGQLLRVVPSGNAVPFRIVHHVELRTIVLGDEPYTKAGAGAGAGGEQQQCAIARPQTFQVMMFI